MAFKLVALDVDGTLLDQKRQILPSVREAIQQVRALGTQVTLCTGRMFASAFPFAEELALDLPLITYNGGLVMDPDTKEILYQRSLARDYAVEIMQAARERGFTINYYHEDRLLVEEITEGNQLYAQWSGVALHEVDDLLALESEPTKILVIGQPDTLSDFEAESQDVFKENVYITKSWPNFLEFLHPEATKGRGLTALAGYLNIPREQIMGIGDSYNDLEMFNFTGLSVAMGNADEPIKEAADYVTVSNDEGGVARALEKFIIRATENKTSPRVK